MSWWRRTALARIVAMVLLLWTAADLSNSGLCALENEGAAGIPRSSATTVDHQTSNRAPVDTPVPHVDDCFCCSHCVEVQGLVPEIVSTLANRDFPPLVLAEPRGFSFPLYHPPLV